MFVAFSGSTKGAPDKWYLGAFTEQWPLNKFLTICDKGTPKRCCPHAWKELCNNMVLIIYMYNIFSNKFLRNYLNKKCCNVYIIHFFIINLIWVTLVVEVVEYLCYVKAKLNLHNNYIRLKWWPTIDVFLLWLAPK